MARGGFDYSQFQKLYENVRRMEAGSVKFIEDFLLEMGLRAMAKVKKRQADAKAVDTGDMLNKWQLSGITRRGNDVMIMLSNSALYASFVEYGHWQKVGRFVPGHWEGDRFVYEPGSKGGMVLKNPWVDGVFMLTISIQEIEREMPRRLEAAWKQYAESLLRG